MKVLIIDDEINIHKTTSIALRTMGHEPYSAYSGSQSLSKLDENRIDVVFLDLRLGSENGLEVYDRIRAAGHEMPVIIFTGFSSISSAIEATKKGVFDYVLKPFVPEQIRQTLERVGKQIALKSKVVELESQVSEIVPPVLFDSQEKSMQQIYRLAQRAAPSEATVLILGPSGTGKTVLAKQIHSLSPRADKPFVVVHCPSLSKELLESELFGHVKGAFTGAVKDTWGKIDSADGGSIFLDEIGELPMEIQAKLLRFLQERQYERVGETKTRTGNVRILAATNNDLQAEAQDGRFREDLFYRLNVISIHMPPLNERRGDIPKLAQHFLQHHAKQMARPQCRFSEDCLAALARYDWPGNLRELHNVVERCLILCDDGCIEVQDLPPEVQLGSNGDGPNAPLKIGGPFKLEDIEEAHINGVIASAKSYQQAARILGINKTTLYRKRKRKLSLEREHISETEFAI
ncbi:sigma-54 dependent transcriptional regulator [Pelagicoccus sp. SDUM812005]|uniref:sigma-54-dependent transcriptional regulator n=1 Tax=Pelagicoccus sp. SDUM812005 TaxID=3041257 RepID=UPI00280D6FF5|nr:sigma-54 dependent transcriptional regulator [Pelagicoccus sp. SDUM812005]MDQ8180701.1 sigma-54 dependent transcriptional regulator [Pelagicoccus sp. SDUM812005]